MDSPALVPLSFERKTETEMRAAAEANYAGMRSRRSVRDFAPDPVPQDIIATCLQAAGTAPNGANLQPWHFVAIGDAGVKQCIREAAEAEEREFYAHRAPNDWRKALAPLGTNAEKPFLSVAPWLIAIFAVNAFVDPATGERRPTYYPKESVGIATGFLISALHAAGLATLTHTPSPMNFLNEILDRPTTEKPFLLLVAGYPAPGTHVPNITKKPLESIASFV
ncbi:nitroreductase family protein [Synoicihabitans lomoniglobus]|uniref:Nitroreductase family protein n=1 Tax=Synoicihabitans lomoniglobus TaxID=2909285 RepID=A0AAE9ZZU2_9BACT|nr:nitroreductase family protein [Opitutaceae bacterium LMO-M01]WED63727.1 nitroreductase family protein [Opitutaceae bacterium LMO-M01]